MRRGAAVVGYTCAVSVSPAETGPAAFLKAALAEAIGRDQTVDVEMYRRVTASRSVL